MTIYAKTDGKTTLDDHVRHLKEEGDSLIAVRSVAKAKYHQRTGRNLDKMLMRAILWHDEGKKDPEWQACCRENRLHTVKVRHELVSLCLMHKEGITASHPVRAAIAAHHGKLGWRHEDHWTKRGEFRELNLWGQFRQVSDRIDNVEQAICSRYEFDGPRSWLQLCDHRASAKESGVKLPAHRSFAYTFPFGDNKRGVQKMIEEQDIWTQPFAIIRASTGSGKTDAALLWAQKQIEAKKADRLVIAMPTRFTANSLAISKPEEVGTSGLYHSTSRFMHSDKNTCDKDMQQLAEWEQVMARTLEVPITVTTLDHLCICLTATREDHHSVFFNLANSCVVIDEADFYDSFTQHNLIVLLRTLRVLNVPVLMMSATIPESARQLYSDNNRYDIPPIYEDTSDYDRPRCRLTRVGKVFEPSEIVHLLRRALTGEPTIIYANTVRRAQAYYRWFHKQNPSFACKNVVLYHSRFTETHKAMKEGQLLEMLGKEAWKPGHETAHGVAILTQIGELSVNISADFMIADLCPADRLAQRIGRLSRFSDRIGEVYVLDPCNLNKGGDRVFYPAPYGRFISSRWVTSDALDASRELLKDGEYTARDFVNIVNLVYPSIPEISSTVRENRRTLENLILVNWLILPAEDKKQVEDEEEDHTEHWRSRDIPPQKSLYVNSPFSKAQFDDDSSFHNRTEFRRFQLDHGVQCQSYEFERAFKNGILSEYRDKRIVLVGEDKETIWTVPEQYYSFEKGLCLDENLGDEVDE